MHSLIQCTMLEQIGISYKERTWRCGCDSNWETAWYGGISSVCDWPQSWKYY